MEFEWVPSTEVLCNPEILYVSKVSDGVRFYPRGRNLMWCCHSNIMKRYDCCTSNESWFLLIEWSLHVWQCWNRVYSDSIILPLFVCPMTRTMKDSGAPALKWNPHNWSSSHYQAWDPEWWLVTQPASIVWQKLWGIMEPSPVFQGLAIY